VRSREFKKSSFSVEWKIQKTGSCLIWELKKITKEERKSQKINQPAKNTKNILYKETKLSEKEIVQDAVQEYFY